MRVEIAIEVPRGVHERVQRVTVPLGMVTSTVRAFHSLPLLIACSSHLITALTAQWGDGFITRHLTHAILRHRRQLHGQVCVRHRDDSAVRAVDGGNWRAPVALTTYQPISQAQLRCGFAPVFGLRLCDDAANCCRNVESRELSTVHQLRVLHHAGGGQVQQAGEGAVSRVVQWNAHHSTITVVCQHVVAHKDRNGRVCDWMHHFERKPVASHATFAHLVGTFADVIQLRVKGEDGFDKLAKIGVLAGEGECDGVRGCQTDERNAHDRFDVGGENGNCLVLAHDLEFHTASI